MNVEIQIVHSRRLAYSIADFLALILNWVIWKDREAYGKLGFSQLEWKRPRKKYVMLENVAWALTE